jgi:hypothetical protein
MPRIHSVLQKNLSFSVQDYRPDARIENAILTDFGSDFIYI